MEAAFCRLAAEHSPLFAPPPFLLRASVRTQELYVSNDRDAARRGDDFSAFSPFTPESYSLFLCEACTQLARTLQTHQLLPRDFPFFLSLSCSRATVKVFAKRVVVVVVVVVVARVPRNTEKLPPRLERSDSGWRGKKSPSPFLAPFPP